MGQPTDTTKNFVAIPPFPNIDGGNTNAMYAIVSNENLDAMNGSILSRPNGYFYLKI